MISINNVFTLIFNIPRLTTVLVILIYNRQTNLLKTDVTHISSLSQLYLCMHENFYFYLERFLKHVLYHKRRRTQQINFLFHNFKSAPKISLRFFSQKSTSCAYFYIRIKYNIDNLYVVLTIFRVKFFVFQILRSILQV